MKPENSESSGLLVQWRSNWMRGNNEEAWRQTWTLRLLASAHWPPKKANLLSRWLYTRQSCSINTPFLICFGSSLHHSLFCKSRKSARDVGPSGCCYWGAVKLRAACWPFPVCKAEASSKMKIIHLASLCQDPNLPWFLSATVTVEQIQKTRKVHIKVEETSRPGATSE